MKYIELFLEQVKAQGYKLNTLNTFKIALYRLENYSTKPLQELSEKELQDYYQYLTTTTSNRTGETFSNSYIKHHLYAIRLFFDFLEDSQIITENIAQDLHHDTPVEHHRKPLSQQQITLLYQQCVTLQERIILHLFYALGLRRTEAEQLQIKDIHLRTGLVYVRSGKGGKRREVPMSSMIIEDFARHIQRQEKYLLTGKIGRPLSGNVMSKQLRKIAKNAQLTAPCTPHILRHSIATHLLENGLTLEEVRDFLGHKHLETTQIYIKHLKEVKHKK
jgi:integrase/recombinase XerD